MYAIQRLFLALFTFCVGLLAACGDAQQEAPKVDVSWPTAALVDPNTATAAELSAVAGLSETDVESILATRPFETPSELNLVIADGKTDDQRRQIYLQMFVKVALNSGALEDYELIPSSLSPGKLAHEFEEYRPYETLDDFTREMAKYVSDDEVAHLARYVIVD